MTQVEQPFLINDHGQFPSTRFQGSKLKIINWIWDSIKFLNFQTALDAFGGTGSVAHLLKAKGKQVTYNDILKFNGYFGLALIENDFIKLSNVDLDFLFSKHSDIKYSNFVTKTFEGIYFTDQENEWIDMVVTNIDHLENSFKKAIAYFALCQSCIIKRPFNLFHRKNLYIRLSEVKRNFGNKTTWDTPFEIHFRKFVKEANLAVFSNGCQNKAVNFDVFDLPEDYDLVYIDTPYISNKGSGVNYLDFYHFLEGLVNYQNWDSLIDYKSINRRLKGIEKSEWNNKKTIHAAFDRLFYKFRQSILVVSYRSDGIPLISELISILKQYKKEIVEVKKTKYKYVLSNNGHSEEVLLIGK